MGLFIRGCRGQMQGASIWCFCSFADGLYCCDASGIRRFASCGRDALDFDLFGRLYFRRSPLVCLAPLLGCCRSAAAFSAVSPLSSVPFCWLLRAAFHSRRGCRERWLTPSSILLLRAAFQKLSCFFFFIIKSPAYRASLSVRPRRNAVILLALFSKSTNL